jgi:hypothetical protein
MAPTTLSTLISASGTGSGDLAPLAANTTFERSVNAELAARDAVVLATEARAARTEDLVAGVSLFAGAMRSIRAVAKRFPETSKFMDEAAKQTQAAMGAAAYNPQPLVTDKDGRLVAPGTPVLATVPVQPVTPKPAPTPLPASVPVTQPKPAPLPPTTVTGQPPVAAPPFRPPTPPEHK